MGIHLSSLTGSRVHCSERQTVRICRTGKGLRLPSVLLEEGCLYSPHQVESQFAKLSPTLACLRGESQRLTPPREPAPRLCICCFKKQKTAKDTSQPLFSSLCFCSNHMQALSPRPSHPGMFGSWFSVHPGAWQAPSLLTTQAWKRQP